MRVDWAYAMAVRTNRVAQDRPECRIAPSAGQAVRLRRLAFPYCLVEVLQNVRSKRPIQSFNIAIAIQAHVIVGSQMQNPITMPAS